MKKLIGFTVILILLSLTITAQGRNGRYRQGPNLTNEQFATLQTKKMALRLDLNENQQEAVHKLMLKTAEDREKFRTEFMAKRQNGVPLTEDEQFAFENERLERQLANKTAMKKILNAEQYKIWETQIMGKRDLRIGQKGNRNFNKRQYYN